MWGFKSNVAATPIPVKKHAERSYSEAEIVEKNKAEIALLKNAIENNSLFTCLDQPQIENFVKGFRLVSFAAGETVFVQGNPGENFYVVDEGDLDVFDVDAISQKGQRVSTKMKGDNFGEGSFLFGRRRSATIVASTPVKLWILDSASFQDVLDSPQIRRIYDTYASRVGADGTKTMSMQDFVRACTSSADPAAYAQIAALYRIFVGDTNGEMKVWDSSVSYKDFTIFNLLMTRPDPHFEIAFMLMDRDKKGVVTLDDVRHFLKDVTLPNGIPFKFECDLVKRFFGPDGKRALRISNFSAFFCQLHVEMGQQAFVAALRPGTTQMNAETFVNVLTTYGGGDVPKGFMQRLAATSVRREGVGPRGYNFAHFLAFQHLLDNLPAVTSVIIQAAKAKGSESYQVSKDDFKMASRVLLNPLISRLHADAVFQIFDIDKDGLISKNDLKFVLGDAFNKKVIASTGREGKLTLVPPPGSPYQSTNTDSAQEAPVKPISERLYLAVIDFLEHFALGAIAGGIGATAVYPIDLIKTRLQNQRTALTKAKGGAAVATILKDGSTLPHYNGALDCLRQTIRREGVRGLYRGLLPQLVGVAPEKAIKLTVNDMLRDAFTNRDKISGNDDIYFPLEVLAGCGAGASQVLFTNPLEIVKIRLQVQGETEAMLVAAGKPVPPRQSAISIVRQLGISGLYKGAPACLLRDVPFSGIYFPCYAAAKKWLAGDQGKLEPHHLLLAGALAGIPAASLVTPADVIKTRLQVVAREGEATYTGIGDAFTKIVTTEGVPALFKGAVMRVIRSSPQFGVTLLAYELLYRALSPSSAPRPPTNAPIPWQEYDDAFRKKHVESEAASLWGLMRPLGGESARNH